MCVCLCVSVGRKLVGFLLAAASLKPPKRTFSLTLNQNTLSLSRALSSFYTSRLLHTRTLLHYLKSAGLTECGKPNESFYAHQKRKISFVLMICTGNKCICKKKNIVHKQLSTQRFISVLNCKNIFQETSIICEGNPTL